MHLSGDDFERAVALRRRVPVAIPAGHVLRERARVHDEPRVVCREHEDGGAGVHRHVASEHAVLDVQRRVLADGRQGALVVHEPAAVDPHQSVVGRRPVADRLGLRLQPDRRLVQVDDAEDARRVDLILEQRSPDDDACLVGGERQMDAAQEARLRRQVREPRPAYVDARRLVAHNKDGRLVEDAVLHDQLRHGAGDVVDAMVVADAGLFARVLADHRRVGDVHGDGETVGQGDDAGCSERTVDDSQRTVGDQHRPVLDTNVLQPRPVDIRTSLIKVLSKILQSKIPCSIKSFMLYDKVVHWFCG